MRKLAKTPRCCRAAGARGRLADQQGRRRYQTHPCMSLGGVAVLLVLGDADRTEAEQRGMRQRVAAAGGRCSINGNPPLPAVELSHIVSDGWDTFRRCAPSLARRYAGTDGPPPKRQRLGPKALPSPPQAAPPSATAVAPAGSERPSVQASRLALADPNKPTATIAANQDLVDIFWVLADATFRAEPENARSKGSSYYTAARAFANVGVVASAETVTLAPPRKLAGVGKACVNKMSAFRETGTIPKLLFYQDIIDGGDGEGYDSGEEGFAGAAAAAAAAAARSATTGPAPAPAAAAVAHEQPLVTASLPVQQQPQGSDFCHLVTQAWLTATLLAGEPQPESEFVMPPFRAGTEPADNNRTAAAASAPVGAGDVMGPAATAAAEYEQQQCWRPHDDGGRAATTRRIEPPAAPAHTETVDDHLHVRVYRSFLAQGEADALFECLGSSVERGGLGMGEDTRPQTGAPSRLLCMSMRSVRRARRTTHCVHLSTD
jgi:hypothetical protein